MSLCQFQPSICTNKQTNLVLSYKGHDNIKKKMCVCKCESVVNLAIHMCVQGESGRWEARGERPQRH